MVRVQNGAPAERVRRFRPMLRRIAPFWVMGVVIGSFLPGSWKRDLGTHPYTPLHAVSFQHRAVHFVTFGLTALLFLALAQGRRGRAKAVAGAILLGLAIEAGQYAVGLSAVLEWWDIRDDLFAIAGAAVVFGVWRWLRQRRAKP